MKPNNNLKPYFNLQVGTDSYPFELTGVRANIIAIVRPMSASLSNEWKPNIVHGGFAGHCVNQNEQKWNIKSNSEAEELEIRWSKAKNGWYDKHGARFINSEEPLRFHDFNF